MKNNRMKLIVQKVTVFYTSLFSIAIFSNFLHSPIENANSNLLFVLMDEANPTSFPSSSIIGAPLQPSQSSLFLIISGVKKYLNLSSLP